MTTEQDRPNVDVGDRAIAMANVILGARVGSDVHGMAIEGTDDVDLMGVFIEPARIVLGMQPKPERDGPRLAGEPRRKVQFKHYVSRTQPDGVRSGPGDIDLTMYSLRTWMSLATAGNPSILLLLYVPQDAVEFSTPLGDALLALAPQIVSRHASRRFLGYLDGQRERMLGEGKQNRVPKRPELIERYGWDTKYGSHAYRLGVQGIELTRTGRLTLPLPEQYLGPARDMKQGRYSFEQAIRMIDDVRDALAGYIEDGAGPLRDEPDWAAVNDFLTSAHRSHWGWS